MKETNKKNRLMSFFRLSHLNALNQLGCFFLSLLLNIKAGT
jgi:hypothetical protein